MLAASANHRRSLFRLLLAASLFLACAAIASAQIRVPGNSGPRWVDTGIQVENGTQVQITATGTVNVGPRGSFGPEGTTAFPGDRSLSFPTDQRHLYGLVIRLTSSPTNPEDELRDDYAYGESPSICFRAPGHLWLTVNDGTPADNTGEFLVNIARGSCSRTDPGGRSTRVQVQDQRGAPAPDAEVYLNGQRRGVTGSDGTLLMPELRAGDRLIARKLIQENSTDRAEHRTGSTRNWNYRVYLTTVPVNNDGTLSPFVVSDPSTQQVLRLSQNNTLIGLHLVASLEWDASADEMRALKNELVASSQGLYNATDGQFIFEQIDLFDRSEMWDSADVRIFANWSLRANANGAVGGFLSNNGWMNLQRNDWWYVYTHEFGHYGLDLYDEYSDTDSETYCTRAVTSMTSTFGWWGTNRQPQAACLMWNTAPKFCSQRGENPHVRGTGQGDEDCWTHIVSTYRDRATPSHWTLQSPNTRAAIPGMLPTIPVDSWNTRFNDNTRDIADLCPPITFTAADSIGGRLRGVNVFLRTRGGSTILEGMSQQDDPMTPRNEGGEMTAVGVHNGDELTVDGGTRLRVSRCTLNIAATPRTHIAPSLDVTATLRSPSFRAISGALVIAAHAPSIALAPQQQTVVTVEPRAFELLASLEPSQKAGEGVLRVRAGETLAQPPQALITLGGESRSQKIPLQFDQGANAYIGTVSQLPQQGAAVLAVEATGKGSRRVSLMQQVSFNKLSPKKETEMFSADGQMSLVAPAGTLSEGTRVIIGPAGIAPPVLTDGVEVVSGPFRVAASGQSSLREQGVLRFQLPDIPASDHSDGHNGLALYDPDSLAIYRYNESNGTWERAGGILLREIAIVSLKTNQLGAYALVARPLGAVGNKQGSEQKAVGEQKASGEQKVSGEFSVTGVGLKTAEAQIKSLCPVTVRFTGYITASGPGTVKYTFTRSDGATGPIIALEFKEAGTQEVATTWTLGDASALPAYEGWQAIKILAPNELESDHARFALNCATGKD